VLTTGQLVTRTNIIGNEGRAHKVAVWIVEPSCSRVGSRTVSLRIIKSRLQNNQSDSSEVPVSKGASVIWC